MTVRSDHAGNDLEAALREIAAGALSMSERVSVQTVSQTLTNQKSSIEARLAYWCECAALGDWNKFTRRLQWEGLSIANARTLVADVPPSVIVQLPSWARTLKSLIEACREWPQNSSRESESSDGDDRRWPFEEFLDPIVAYARTKLKASLTSSHGWDDTYSNKLISQRALAQLESALLRRLSFVSARAFAEEFRTKQAAGLLLLRQFGVELPGPPSRERYSSFVGRHLEDGLLTLFRSYPVLGRLVTVLVDSWVEATSEFLERLDADRDQLGEVFSQSSPRAPLGPVADIDTNLSDPHRGGRTVLRLEFDTGLRVLYKPKDLGLETAWLSLLRWWNEHDAPLVMKTQAVIPRKGYGWVEYVEREPCVSREQIQRFYQRAGIMLFHLYLLGATDCHAENLIASGEYPVLVDMETLLHPDGTPIGADRSNLDSVLRTGLLPRWECREQTRRLMDLSGLGQAPEQVQHHRVWRFLNTDEMYPDWEIASSPTISHLPTLNGVIHGPDEFLEDLVWGFEQMYRCAQANRRLLRADDGPLVAFKNQQGRLIFRATKIYFEILDDSLCAKSLAHGAERSIELERLAFAFLVVGDRPLAWPIFRAEIDAMERLDIPYFTCDSTTDVLNGLKEPLLRYVRAPGFERMIARQETLGDRDRTFQSELIRGTFLARVADVNSREDTLNFESVDDAAISVDGCVPLTANHLLDEANAIGYELLKRAIPVVEGRRSWLGLTYILNTEQFQVNLLTANLYDGTTGVAVFLSALNHMDGPSEFGELALEVVSPLREMFVTDQEGTGRLIRRIGIGGAVGFGSIVYALVRMAQFLHDDSLLEEALLAVSSLSVDTIRSANKLDVVDGVAGCLLAMLALYRATDEKSVLERAIACGELLVSCQGVDGLHRGAWSSNDGGTPMTGFSHGSSGIACSLNRLYEVTEHRLFSVAATRAFAAEQSAVTKSSVMEPREGYGSAGRSMVSWCHGAAGMALARLDAISANDSHELRQEAELALRVTEHYGLNALDSLCCGNLGRVETLLTAYSALGQERFGKLAQSWTSAVVQRAANVGRYRLRSNAVPGKVLFNPPMFHGMAGIGYQLLRVARPDVIPSLLLWR